MDKSIFTYVAYDEHDERHHGAVTFPIYQNTLFTFAGYNKEANRFTYSRSINPTVQELEKRLAVLEGGEAARCCSSGMAAISGAILSQVKSGDHIVCVNQAYPGTREFLQNYLSRFGVQTTFVNGASLAEIEAAFCDQTVLLYLESPTSFFFELQDISACTALAKRYGVRTILDNSWATPCFQRPLDMGVDLVVHSLTKYIGGHSDVLGGVIIGTEAEVERIMLNEGILLGGVMTAHTASLMLRGLRTLPLRMERYQQTGKIVAEFLNAQLFLGKINYPGLVNHPQHELAMKQMSGFGGLLSFEWNVSVERAQTFADLLKYFRNGCSWGGYESLVMFLGRTSDMGVANSSSSNSLIRLYTGMEEPEDLLQDLERAFKEIMAMEQG